MSIVSGISTAPGISPLLNAPRETQQTLRIDDTTDAGQLTRARPGQITGHPLADRPVSNVTREANAGQHTDIRQSSDSRYTRFVKAVQALRMDPTDAILDDKRVAELIDAAEGFFLVDDGVPREVQPLPPEALVKIEPPEPEPEPAFWEHQVEEARVEAEEAESNAAPAADSERLESEKTPKQAAEEKPERPDSVTKMGHDDVRDREPEPRQAERREERPVEKPDARPKEPERSE